MTNNVLLSYVGSGNHLVRFFIELLTERPTLGWRGAQGDVPICNAVFEEPVPFNITQASIPIFRKEHGVPENQHLVEQLILIVRNPKEVLVRQVGINLFTLEDGILTEPQELQKHSINYASMVKYYVDFKGPKLLIFYEDMITKKEEFIQQLYNFLNPNKPEKLAYALQNVEKLFRMSRTGKNRIWIGPRSDGSVAFYYDKLKNSAKRNLTATVNAFIHHPSLQGLLLRYSS